MPAACDALRRLLASVGLQTLACADADGFLTAYRADQPGCLVLDTPAPGCRSLAILQRLRPPVLVMVTAADGYRAAIRQRLAGSGYPLRLALEEGLADAAAWREVGEIIPSSAWQDALPSAPWRGVLLPFLDYPQASDLLNGTLRNPVSRCAHEALLAGIPVLALRYHCDPHSELNRLRGAQAGSAYAGHLQTTLARLEACGVFLGTMNELLAKLDAPTS